MSVRVLDLFSGIGGFSLGMERAGMRTVAFCEIDPYCQRVLARHWPNVPVYSDVRQLTAERLRADGIAVDVVTAGFPCQDISVAGRNAGLDASRSGLWRHVTRLAGELRPRYVILENVPALLVRGLGTILADLAALGFDAEWHCIPAAALGAPHRRDRIWIVAYPNRRDKAARQRVQRSDEGGERMPEPWGAPPAPVADAESDGWSERQRERISWSGAACAERQGHPVGTCPDGHVAHPCQPRLPLAQPQGWHAGLLSQADIRRAAERCHWWDAEPDVDRVAHGVPARVDRLRALGNAIVPQIAEMIGGTILEAAA